MQTMFLIIKNKKGKSEGKMMNVNIYTCIYIYTLKNMSDLKSPKKNTCISIKRKIPKNESPKIMLQANMQLNVMM